jgi:pyridoxine/pyridoxamine 5'-phosphate oxidase
MSQDDFEYFTRRANEERLKADASPGSCHAASHRMMAAEYARRLKLYAVAGRVKTDGGLV